MIKYAVSITPPFRVNESKGNPPYLRERTRLQCGLPRPTSDFGRRHGTWNRQQRAAYHLERKITAASPIRSSAHGRIDVEDFEETKRSLKKRWERFLEAPSTWRGPANYCYAILYVNTSIS